VELSTRMSDQLSLLALGTVHDGSGLVGDLAALTSTLTEAVSGYAGLRLTLLHADRRVRLTALSPVAEGRDIVTSLRMPLPTVAGTTGEGGDLVVWSAVPGALVDLSADVGHVLSDPADRLVPSTPSLVELDSDLPTRGTRSGVQGLDELATISRATGVLIALGQDPRTVHDVLDARAAAEGLTAEAWSERLLRGARAESTEPRA